MRLSAETEENHETPVSVGGLMGEIWTQDHPNTKQEWYPVGRDKRCLILLK